MSKDIQEIIEVCKAIRKNMKYESTFDLNILKLNRNNKEAIETILNYIETLETATNNKYPYVEGGRTLYSRLQQLDKEDLIKAYLRLRNETEQLIQDKKNSIPTEVIEKKIKELLEIKRHSNDSIAISSANIIINFLQDLLENK